MTHKPDLKKWAHESRIKLSTVERIWDSVEAVGYERFVASCPKV